MIKKYFIEGNPIALQKPRLARGGDYCVQKHMYEIVREKLIEQHGSDGLFSGPVKMELTFGLPLPQHKRKYQEKQSHAVRPNLCSLIQMAHDTARGIIYKDEACISSLQAFKYYTENPFISFTIETVDEA